MSTGTATNQVHRGSSRDRRSSSDISPSGVFAEYHGVRCPTVNPYNPNLRLLLPDGVEPGPEFTEDEDGEWSAYVPRTDADRIYVLTTRARWGEHDVEVVQRGNDGRLRVQGWTYPPPPGSTPRENTHWFMWVDPQELTDVVETVLEIAP